MELGFALIGYEGTKHQIQRFDRRFLANYWLIRRQDGAKMAP
jgi:hypothetical protein